MSTDADLPDFHTALNNALKETNQIQRLLVHPEFHERLRQLCRRIANSDDVADLVDEVGLRISKFLMEPAGFQTEHQFFGWVAGVAKKVHRDQKRYRFEKMTCTDSGKHWPNSSADVPEDRIDEYMDHALKCAYHAELISLEEQPAEQELRSIFRRARGLDRHGRLLRGELLNTTIVDHERRLTSWKKEITTLPINRIALYNGEKEIASCGRFFDFTRHESVNELDPQVGLQILGISNFENENVLIGSYALAGVRHEGVEQRLPLDNGFTVGLTIVRLNERTFAVGFRCVETESLEELSPAGEYSRNDAQLPDWLGDVGSTPKVSAINSVQFRSNRIYFFLLKCGAGIKLLPGWTISMAKALIPSRAFQVGVIILAAGLAIEHSDSLNHWLKTKLLKQPATSISAVINGIERSQLQLENHAGTNSHPEPQIPAVSEASNPQRHIVTRIDGHDPASTDQGHTGSNEANRLIQYTSRVRRRDAAAPNLGHRNEMLMLSGNAKFVRVSEKSVHAKASLLDPYTAKKLAGLCQEKIKK